MCILILWPGTARAVYVNIEHTVIKKLLFVIPVSNITI